MSKTVKLYSKIIRSHNKTNCRYLYDIGVQIASNEKKVWTNILWCANPKVHVRTFSLFTAEELRFFKFRSMTKMILIPYSGGGAGGRGGG